MQEYSDIIPMPAWLVSKTSRGRVQDALCIDPWHTLGGQLGHEHPGGGQVARYGGQNPVAVGELSGDAVGDRGAARTEVCHRGSQGIDQHVHVEQGLDLRTAQNKHSLQPPEASHPADGGSSSTARRWS
ncbi:hypothetical protein [Streptomyces sp. NPDC102487]|uniref:hypothetical protein n=1 Tax=Streptomyces sp. NPDC102487 TaxID=3366182 RepID=UPI003803BE34